MSVKKYGNWISIKHFETEKPFQKQKNKELIKLRKPHSYDVIRSSEI